MKYLLCGGVGHHTHSHKCPTCGNFGAPPLEMEHVTEPNLMSTATAENNDLANEVPTQRDNNEDTPSASTKQTKMKGKG
jgi:hypothetical protein